jgi:3-hydroxyisobutyrate dehydrogenase-like beta-hydroxyacid dehydrogenase
MREIEGPVGAASALKMSYAGITKGLIAVASAMALGATRAGVQEALLQELAESQPELLQRLRTMIPGVYSKAYRWVAEMEEIAAFLEGVHEAGDLYRGAAGLYRDLAEEYPDGADIAALERFFQRSNGR